ncbi:MAG: protein kinase domain-containing protein [Planctomycetota bacterium]|jgi:tRNA A-37 threonylcarbamoyl transferase component Bud32
MAEEQKCQQCGARLPANAPGGICPKCVMKLALPTGADPEKPPAAGQHAVPTSATPPGGFVPPEPAELGEKLPGLEIIELLGQGGMGAVYKARQKQLDRIVALKILPPEVGADPAFAERFTREARSLAKLNHPHIVTVYEFGQSDDLYFFIMEFVDGTDLRHVIRKGDLAADEALTIVPQVCEALQYAHEEGVVHRDIKPENIFLDKRGHVKIGDFGLAKLLDKPATAFTLTQPQQRMGTPHYMAPEQIEGAHQVDHRADIYSLGVVFYEMLTGQLPIGRFPSPSQKVHVDVRLDEVVLRSLEHEPERRYQHASEIKTDVESIAVDAEHQEPAGKPTEIEHESPEQFILSQLPTARIDAVKAYQKKTGAGRTEAVLAIDAIMRKHGIKFTPLPLKRRVRHALMAIATVVVYGVLYILFRRHAEISSTIGWSIMALFCVSVFVFFSVAAWRSRAIDKGLQFRVFVGIFLLPFFVSPLIVFLIKPTLILNRLYGLTDATPGLHDVLFLRIVVGAIIVAGLYWLLRLWLQFRAFRRAAAGLEFAKSHKEQNRHASEMGEGMETVAVAQQRLRIPAVGLFITGAMSCILPGIMLGFTGQRQFGSLVGFIAVGFIFGTGLIVIAGAWAMTRLQSYRLAVAGSIVAMFSATFLLGLPMGIWAIIVLSNADVQTAFAARKSQLAAGEKRGNPASVLAVVAVVIIVLALLAPTPLMLMISSHEFDRPGPLIIRASRSARGPETSVQKIGDLDFPYGTWDYIEFGQAGPTLTEQCAQTLDLKPSELLAVNNILQNAHRQYLELEASYTTEQRTDDRLEVTIAPFRDQALPFLEQLWDDLDAVLDARKQAIVRRHLPFGRMFGTYQFGEPTAKITISKQGKMFLYETKYEWPKGSRKDGGGGSGGNSTLPPEYQRFWDETAPDK